MTRLNEKCPDRAPPFVGSAIGVGGHAPVGFEFASGEQAESDLGVADVESEEHESKLRSQRRVGQFDWSHPNCNPGTIWQAHQQRTFGVDPVRDTSGGMLNQSAV